ncbi:alpha/beta fold hydrolase [Variovorax sp. GB1P17]|uniref:alpha/beta hydrolase n=1 Tax=Variovorax sp. GB1P17 TaxID=3443740 RepID=UPI003F47E7AB
MPAPGELHTIDGLSMHLQRSGPAPTDALQPTLVIEAGGGCASPIYARMQQVLSAKYPVVSYDRPGMGWSDIDCAPFDAQRNAHRLHALLDAAGVSGPIVLIGHSLGGLLMRVYTGLYPAQVVGLVMLDASHPDQFEEIGEMPMAQVAMERDKRVKFQEGGPPPPELAMAGVIFADMPHVVQQLTATFTPESIDTMAREIEGLPHVARQAAAVVDLGARPLAVLWAPVQLPAGSDSATAIQKRWPSFQQAHAALSSRGRSHEVAGADHMSLVLLPPFVNRVAEEVDRMMAQLGSER